MWPDNETVLDLIGYRVHADLVREVVMDAGMLPVTIGLFGDWGSGKSSIMRMLQYDLDPENHSGAERKIREHIACLYFNGWLFEGYDDAKTAILTSILLQLGEHKSIGPRVKNRVVSLLKSNNSRNSNGLTYSSTISFVSTSSRTFVRPATFAKTHSLPASG